MSVAATSPERTVDTAEWSAVGRTSVDRGAASVRAVSFNVLHGRRAGPDGPVDLDVLMRSVASLRPDLLALQEVDVGVPRSGRDDQARAVADALGMEVVFGKATRVGVIGRYGNALLGRGPIADVEVIGLPRTARRHEPRSAILATVDVGGVSLSVCATHLSVKRPEVFEQLSRALDALAARPGPLVLIGDLNLATTDVRPLVEAHGMVLAGGPPTYPRSDPRHRIDHLAARGLGIGAVEVITTQSSDHCALVVELEIRKRSPREQGRTPFMPNLE